MTDWQKVLCVLIGNLILVVGLIFWDWTTKKYY